MDLGYHELLQLVDRLYRQHGTRPFLVGGAVLDLDTADQLCGFGLLTLHAHVSWPRAGDLTFRAVPAPGTEAPYALVPMTGIGAPAETAWTATLTEEAEKLAYRKRTKLTTAVMPVKPLPRLYGRWPFQATLDAGGWAPQQLTVFEELALVVPSGPRMRKLFGR
jgi:hypothetical protein